MSLYCKFKNRSLLTKLAVFGGLNPFGGGFSGLFAEETGDLAPNSIGVSPAAATAHAPVTASSGTVAAPGIASRPPQGSGLFSEIKKFRFGRSWGNCLGSVYPTYRSVGQAQSWGGSLQLLEVKLKEWNPGHHPIRLCLDISPSVVWCEAKSWGTKERLAGLLTSGKLTIGEVYAGQAGASLHGLKSLHLYHLNNLGDIQPNLTVLTSHSILKGALSIQTFHIPRSAVHVDRLAWQFSIPSLIAHLPFHWVSESLKAFSISADQLSECIDVGVDSFRITKGTTKISRSGLYIHAKVAPYLSFKLLLGKQQLDSAAASGSDSTNKQSFFTTLKRLKSLEEVGVDLRFTLPIFNETRLHPIDRFQVPCSGQELLEIRAALKAFKPAPRAPMADRGTEAIMKEYKEKNTVGIPGYANAAVSIVKGYLERIDAVEEAEDPEASNQALQELKRYIKDQGRLTVVGASGTGKTEIITTIFNTLRPGSDMQREIARFSFAGMLGLGGNLDEKNTQGINPILLTLLGKNSEINITDVKVKAIDTLVSQGENLMKISLDNPAAGRRGILVIDEFDRLLTLGKPKLSDAQALKRVIDNNASSHGDDDDLSHLVKLVGPHASSKMSPSAEEILRILEDLWGKNYASPMQDLFIGLLDGNKPELIPKAAVTRPARETSQVAESSRWVAWIDYCLQQAGCDTNLPPATQEEAIAILDRKLESAKTILQYSPVFFLCTFQDTLEWLETKSETELTPVENAIKRKKRGDDWSKINLNEWNYLSKTSSGQLDNSGTEAFARLHAHFLPIPFTPSFVETWLDATLGTCLQEALITELGAQHPKVKNLFCKGGKKLPAPKFRLVFQQAPNNVRAFSAAIKENPHVQRLLYRGFTEVIQKPLIQKLSEYIKNYKGIENHWKDAYEHPILFDGDKLLQLMQNSQTHGGGDAHWLSSVSDCSTLFSQSGKRSPL